jgi:hypothetical protein
MRRVLFGSFLFLFANELKSQTDSVFIRKIADEIFHHSNAYSNLHTLTKTIGPRLSGSPQTYTSEKWGEDALRKAGADRVYLQKADDPHWVRGGQAKAALVSGKSRQELAVIALGNSVSTLRVV